MLDERKYWSPEIETMPADKLKELQGKRLHELVSLAYERVTLYRHKLDEAGIRPADIKTVDDIGKLPLTDDVKDIRGKPFSEKLTIPVDEIARFNSTSGITTGVPEPIPFSKKDTDNLLDGEAQARWTIGVRPWDIVQVLTNYDWSLMGYERLGARFLLLNAGRYMLDKQISLTKSIGVTVLEYLPGSLPRYFEQADEMGIDIKQTNLRMVIGLGEPWAESCKRKWEALYGIPMMTLWGSMELGTVAAECEARRGMHIFAHRYIVEVIEPETGEVLSEGNEGELVVTPLLYQTMPLIRYRTGDIGRVFTHENCPCGRTLPGMDMVKGRISQIVNIKGKKILPLDVEELIASTEGLASDYEIIVDKPGVLDKLRVKVEHRPGARDLEALKSQVEKAIYRNLHVESEVELLPKGTIISATSKAQRLVKTS